MNNIIITIIYFLFFFSNARKSNITTAGRGEIVAHGRRRRKFDAGRHLASDDSAKWHEKSRMQMRRLNDGPAAIIVGHGVQCRPSTTPPVREGVFSAAINIRLDHRRIN